MYRAALDIAVKMKGATRDGCLRFVTGCRVRGPRAARSTLRKLYPHHSGHGVGLAPSAEPRIVRGTHAYSNQVWSSRSNVRGYAGAISLRVGDGRGINESGRAPVLPVQGWQSGAVDHVSPANLGTVLCAPA